MIDKNKQYRTRNGSEVRIYSTDGAVNTLFMEHTCVGGEWRPCGEAVMLKPCQSYKGHGICRDGFPEKPACRSGEGSLPHCLNPNFFAQHLHAEDGRMVFAEHLRRT